MPKAVKSYAAERVDLEDFERAARTYPQDFHALSNERTILDNQSRFVSGFRVEVPDQTAYPGRIVIHAGDALDSTGRRLYNENQLDVSRTVTLEGSTATFSVEIEFTEGDADVSSRAFWDPTVDQGYDVSGDELPDGQELNINVATRKSPDWSVVLPVSVTGFERDTDPTSTKIPLCQLTTNASGEVTGHTTEKFATTILEVVSTTLLRVQNPMHYPAGTDITVGEGATGQELATVSSVDIDKQEITLSGALTNSHDPGEIVRGTGVGSLNLLVESDVNRYRRDEAGTHYDYRDRLFQGDEIHGDILGRGHASITDRSDTNLQSLKDYVDFLSAQIQEMKWGIADPYTSGTDSSREPPGLSTSLPGTPRYFDRAGGIMPARLAAVTVGDGSSSWGDMNGSTQAVLQAAHDALPAAGGRIFLKRGTYILASDFNWTNTGSVTLEGEEGTTVECNGGSISIATTGVIVIRNLTVAENSGSATAQTGIEFVTSNPSSILLDNVFVNNVSMDVAVAMPTNTQFRRVNFYTGVLATNMASRPLLRSTGAGCTLSGTWYSCQFYHFACTAFIPSLIDLATVAPTTSTNLWTVVDTEFGTIGANETGVHLGATSNVTHFQNTFHSSAGLCFTHVKATGGANLKCVGTVGTDTFATFLDCNGMDHIEVSGHLNTNAIGFSTVVLTNCDYVKIQNCDVVNANLAASLTSCSISVTSTSGTLNDVTIANNTFRASNDLCTGVKFDLNGGTEMTNIRIIGNLFEEFEAGVFFGNTAADGADYKNVLINANEFVDRGVSSVVASYQKIGIYAGTGSTKSEWTISNNQFQNMNPTNSNLVVGASRNGILIGGVLNSDFIITDNLIKNVGDSSNRLDNTGGIRFDLMTDAVVNNNHIDTVEGDRAFGIRLAQSGQTSDSINVVGNYIEAINSDTGESAGIMVWSGTGITISGNHINNVDSNTICGFISWLTSTAGSCSRVTISGNTFSGFSVGSLRTIDIRSQTVDSLTIVGNTAEGSIDRGIKIDSVGGGYIKNVTIGNNVLESSLKNITINEDQNLVATSCERIVISGNSVKCSQASSTNILVDEARLVNISSNFAENTGATSSNITGEGLIYSSISGNVLKIPDTAGNNILLTTGAGLCLIHSNLVDGAGAANSFNTSGTTAGKCLVAGNFYDGAGSFNALDVGVDAYGLLSGAPNPGENY